MKIAIANDVRLAVEALRRVITTVKDYEISWVAADGAEAVRKASLDPPDLILMDLNMPVMDGVEATRLIMAHSPCAILVVTATVEGNISKVFQAMGAGALDAVNTPVIGTGAVSAEGNAALLTKIGTIGTLVGKSRSGSGPRLETIPVDHRSEVTRLVVIGASTGGPKALADIFSAFPRDFSAAIVVVQHVDVQFAPGLADWLNESAPFPVRVAREGDEPVTGTALLAASNDHLIMGVEGKLRYTPHPRQYPYRPSVNVFFSSVAEHWPYPGVAALLTGMGRDGAEGLLSLKKSGWHTIAQDEATSVIYGMPRAAVDLGAAMEILPEPKIAAAIVREMSSTRRSAAAIRRKARAEQKRDVQ